MTDKCSFQTVAENEGILQIQMTYIRKPCMHERDIYAYPYLFLSLCFADEK